MTNEELARQVGASPYVNRFMPGVTYFTFSPEKLDAFADAVIERHEAELLQGAGGPQPAHDFDGHCPVYSASQVAVMAAKKELRMMALESTLRVALEALEFHQRMTRPITSTMEAIEQAKGVLK